MVTTTISDGERRRGEIALQAALLAGVIVALGPPITDNLRFLAFVAAGFLIMTLRLKGAVWRYLTTTAVVAVVGWLPTMLPQAAIEEGHNVFVYPGEETILERELPPPVFEFMRDQFLEQYPRRECKSPRRPSKGRGAKCWLLQEMPDRAFAFSPEGLWREPRYSRVVDSIAFDGLDALRGGFVNDLRYDWDTKDGALDRNHMPYFVMYALPAAVVGGRLCWRGDVLWETSDGGFEHRRHAKKACRTIVPDDTGRRVFGVSIAEDAPLAVSLSLPLPYGIANLAALALRLGGVLAVLLLCLSPPPGGFVSDTTFRRRVVLFAFALGVMAIYVLTRPHDFVFGGNPPIKYGTDGLAYAGYARNILIGLADGDLREVLRGGQDVFEMMPGLAYFRAFERVVFGDTNFLYAAVLLATPFAIWSLAATVVSRRWAWGFAVAFIFLPLLGAVGLWYYNYLHKGMDGGIAEPLALTLFFAALAIILNYLPKPPGRFVLAGFTANVMLALAVLCRPNFAPGAAVVLLVVTWRLWRQQRLAEAILAATGFLPVLFMVWHNYYFGDAFVLATSSAATQMTLTAPPSAYATAVTDLFNFEFDSAALRRVVRQWQRWLLGGVLLPLLLWLIYDFVRGRLNDNARLLAHAALAQHGVLLFWNARSRFTYLAWALTVIALLPYLERATGWLARRWTVAGRPRNP